MTAKQLATALGYKRSDKLNILIKRNESEFTNKICKFKINPLELQPNLLINYHGVIRAAMLSNAPRAIEFRDWAETALYAGSKRGEL